VEELPSPVVQRRRPDEASFRKSFRHVNNVSDPASFFIHFPPESLFTSPESLFRIYRNALFTSPGIRICLQTIDPLDPARDVRLRALASRYTNSGDYPNRSTDSPFRSIATFLLALKWL
jgi:hypothetical protein